MADGVLRDKAKQFAKDIVFLCREIKSSHKEAVLVNQLLRSATSIGANLHEAQYAQSKNDFISKLEIAQKETSSKGLKQADCRGFTYFCCPYEHTPFNCGFFITIYF